MKPVTCVLLLFLLSVLAIVLCDVRGSNEHPRKQRTRSNQLQSRHRVFGPPGKQAAFATTAADLKDIDLLMGRFDTSHVPSYLSFDWSGISFAYTFSGARSVPAISLDDNGNVYQVLLYVWTDGKPSIKNETLLETKTRSNAGRSPNASPIIYPLLNDPSVVLDPNQKYSLVVSKRTEALFGVVNLYGFVTASGHRSRRIQVHNNVARYLLSSHHRLGSSGNATSPPITTTTTTNNKKKKKTKTKKGALPGPKSIEFLGDSLSCGYGNEGKYPCKFSAITENALKSFPIMTANILNATYSLTCWSGMGVVRNFNDPNTTSTLAFPAVYPRTLANDESTHWNWDRYVPEAVVITLGTNDFSTPPRPSYYEFSRGYHKLLNAIRENYYPRKPHIFCVAFGSSAAYGSYTEMVVEERNDKLIHYVKLADFKPEHTGCDFHPTVEGDWEAAQALSSAISDAFSH